MVQPSGSQKDFAPFTTMSQLPESTSQIIPVKEISTVRNSGTDNLIPVLKDIENGSVPTKFFRQQKNNF